MFSWTDLNHILIVIGKMKNSGLNGNSGSGRTA